jgi:predicted Zn finger-like uncharacterized protein
MDVTCERCGTEYEFDETLLSSRGTSVKCTNCGHVFKVYPTAQGENDRATSSWRLKLKDGSIDTIHSLRELQRRIGSGELEPANEIARGDESWKTLGSIPELETFFQAAGVQVPPAEVRAPVTPSSVPPAPQSKDSSLPPGRRPRQPTLLGVTPVERVRGPGAEAGSVTAGATGAATGAESVSATVSASVPGAESAPATVPGAESVPEPVSESVSATVPGSATSSYESPYSSLSTPPLAQIEDAEFEERPRVVSRSSGRPSTPPPAYYEDDDDIPDLPGRGSSPLRWLLLVVIAGGLALMVTQWERVARLVGIGSDPALVAAGVAEGDAGLAEGHPKAYASAIEAYGRAIEAGGDRDPEILARLSKAYAFAAQAQVDRGVTGESIGSLSAVALTTAQSAAEIEPRDLDAKLATADALRLAGDNAEARTVLEEARSMSFSRTAEFFRIDARLIAAEAGGGLENGLRSAKQAAELAPEGVPYLLLLARAELAAGDGADARVPLETILADHPEQPVAIELLAELDAANAVQDAGVASDAGVTAAGSETAAETETGAGAEAGSETAAETAAETGAAPGSEVVPVAGTVKAAAEKPAPKRRAPAKKRSAPKKPAYDEYDQLAKAAGDDAFVDGRPPVRDYEWYMRQGRAELAGGNYSRARAFFDSALEARPGSAEAMDGLGQVSMRIEDFESALRYFRVAAQRGQADGYFSLGKAYERLGRNEEAVSAYYTYVKRRPSGSHAAAARAAIKTLEPHAKLPPEPEPEPKSEPKSEPQPEPESGAASEPSPAGEPAHESEPAAP